MKNFPFIIAEAAQGFEGNHELANLLAKAASKAGANAIKFQMVIADELCTRDYKYHDLFKSLELTEDQWSVVKKTCDKHSIELLFDVFGEKSLGVVNKLDVKKIKIHPTDICNIDFLNKVKTSSIDTVFLGIGGAHLEEIEFAHQILTKKEIVLILGFQGYPTNINENNILRIKGLRKKFPDLGIGFADHEPSEEMSLMIASMALGAGYSFIEKHMTLAKCLKLEDYESALNPDEFENYSRKINIAFEALGVSESPTAQNISKSEQIYRELIRRDVVAIKKIKKGKTILPTDLGLRRTNQKDPIKNLQSVFQKIALTDLEVGEAITLENIKTGEI